MIQVFSTRKDKPHAYDFGDLTSPAFTPIEYSISKDGINWTSSFDDPNLTGAYCYQAPDVQPANPTDNLQKIGLMDGSRLVSTSYSTRELKMGIYFEGLDESDAELAYDALQRFLISRDPYWICFSTWPQRMYYVKAKLAAPAFSGDRHWTCEVTFTDLIGLSRSVGTTQDPVLGFGNNLKDKPQYTFTSNTFSIINHSDVMIDPERRGHPFKLTLQGQSSGNMKITNKTTGDVFTRKGVQGDDGKTLKGSDFNGTYVIDGVRPTLNGDPDDLYTDRGVITLQIGRNDFQIDNFSGTITFDYPDWWLS
ncbi:phage tail family protein [Limosilactobacillus pontis]|uniref:phage tail domain-containing protein n=1 Tax=Limosilactobacillus pontis TaxID=35787 RepID=UPI002F26CF4B